MQNGRRRQWWLLGSLRKSLPHWWAWKDYLSHICQAEPSGVKLQVRINYMYCFMPINILQLEHRNWKKSAFRYETTGIRPEFLRDATPLRQVQRKIQDYLCNGEPIWQIRSRGGKARILVGHGLDHDLKCLEVEYPEILTRQDSFTCSKQFWRLLLHNLLHLIIITWVFYLLVNLLGEKLLQLHLKWIRYPSFFNVTFFPTGTLQNILHWWKRASWATH